MTLLYAQHGSEAFNARLDADLHDLGDTLRQKLGDTLVAIVLGGGYGRGEGGVVVRDGREWPYNDLDLTIVVRKPPRTLGQTLTEISHEYHKRIGIDVDFSRPLQLADVRHWPHWLMWQDLLNGHHVLVGEPDVLKANAPQQLKLALPTIEATRLLLNRGAGLLWARAVLAGVEHEPDPDFVRRNYYKAALTLGDAVLIASQCYSTAYTGRDRLLETLAARSLDVQALDLCPLYSEALTFKFQPDHVPHDGFSDERLARLAQRWGRTLLHVELKRTGRTWSSLARYAAWVGSREPELNGPKNWPKNLIRNLRLAQLSIRYPREQLYRTLPKLLGLTGPKPNDWPSRTKRFLKVWKLFN